MYGLFVEDMEVKVIENLGYQGGRYAKVVEYEGIEYVGVKEGHKWVQHVSSLQFGAGYKGQAL